jgi:hypothetical protein
MIPTVELDREQCFLLFATFTGDVERTAHAAGVRPVDILNVSEAEGWNERLRSIIALKQSARPGDIERAINRALNYVQAHRLRLLVERVLHELAGMNTEELKKYLFSEHSPKTGVPFKKLTTRALADLSSALEKAHSMTYLSLGDTVQDRNRRKEQEEDGGSAGDLHSKIAEAMARVKESNSPRALLLDAQLEIANNTAKEAVKPVNPLDSDEH